MGLFLGYFVPLVNESLFMPTPYCFDYCSLVIQSESDSIISQGLFLSQDCFGQSGSFVVPNKYQSCYISVKKSRILTGVTLNLYIALGSMDILIILILPIHEHKYLPIYLCFLKSLASWSYSVKCTDLSPPRLNLFLGTLFILIQL